MLVARRQILECFADGDGIICWRTIRAHADRTESGEVNDGIDFLASESFADNPEAGDLDRREVDRSPAGGS